VSISRPGFDGSTRLAGRHIGDIAADTASVLDHLAADRFAVAGWSGGGPHALACGALLPERVTGVLVIAGCAPYPADGLDWTAGMAADDVAEAEAAMHDPGLLRRLVEPREQWYRVATGADLLEAMAGRFSNVDVAALAPHADEFVACIAEGVTPGVDGWIDDWEAMVTPWGFDVADVAVPTLFWHGDRDESCPLAHAQWMCARMPRASVVVQPGDGHLSIGVRRAAEMFAAFMDAMSI
jgi:pimeloyl-ACP methyl ester carboxylesterase